MGLLLRRGQFGSFLALCVDSDDPGHQHCPASKEGGLHSVFYQKGQ